MLVHNPSAGRESENEKTAHCRRSIRGYMSTCDSYVLHYITIVENAKCNCGKVANMIYEIP